MTNQIERLTVPVDAIGRILKSVMELALQGGVNGASMRDDCVEITHWLACAVAQSEPIVWQVRCAGQAWSECSKEHHDRVLSEPQDFPGYEVRALSLFRGQDLLGGDALPSRPSPARQGLDESMAASAPPNENAINEFVVGGQVPTHDTVESMFIRFTGVDKITAKTLAWLTLGYISTAIGPPTIGLSSKIYTSPKSNVLGNLKTEAVSHDAS